MKGALFPVLIAFVFVALMLPAVGIGYDEASREQRIEGEAVTLEVDDPAAVEYTDETVDGDVTVVVDGNELEQGAEYEWNSGEIELLDATYDNETATVEYTAEIRTAETEDAGSILSVFDGWYAAAILLFASLGAALAAAAWGDL